MKMLKGLVLGLLISLSAEEMALAADTSNAQWQAHMAAAKHFLDVINAKETFRSSRDAAIDSLSARMHAAYPTISDQTIHLYQQSIREEYVQDGDAFSNSVAEVYARHFSQQELSDLAAFYQSRVGKKYVEEMPGLAKEISNLQSDIVEKAEQDFRKKAQALAQKSGDTTK